MKIPPPELKFKVINGKTERDINTAKFFIYAHRAANSGECYIGFSDDPVERWRDHFGAAFNEHSPYYNDPIKKAIRTHGYKFDHFIIDVASTETAAKRKEAAAQDFYKPKLNIRSEKVDSSSSHDYRDFDLQIGINLILKGRRNKKQTFGVEDSARKWVIAEVISEFGRNRLRTVSGQPYPEGMMISISHAEKARFKPGEKVKVKVSDAQQQDGTKYLVAAKSAQLIKVD